MTRRERKTAAAKLLYEDCFLKYKSLQSELSSLKAQNGKALSAAIKEKETIINKLKENIKNIQEKDTSSLPSDIEIALSNTTIYKRIRYIELHPKETMQNEDWEELEATITQLIPTFATTLKGRMEDNEYKICLLTRLGISSSSIANLVGMSRPGISAARKRLLNKICHRTGKPKEFDVFIRQLF